MRRLLLILIVAIALLGVFGVRAGWFHQGFSQAQLEELERDWAEIVGWASLPEIEAAAGGPLTELARDFVAAEAAGAVIARRADDALPRAPRADLPPEVAALLARFEALLAEGRFEDTARPEFTIALLQMGQIALQMDDLDAQRMGRFLAWARTLQREGHLVSIVLGTTLANEALARCREDSSLKPPAISAPPPNPGEFFEAVCRDYVLMYREHAHGTADDGAAPLLSFTAGDEFVSSALQQALVNSAYRLQPLRDEPERFGEASRPEPPGQIALWVAITLRQPEPFTRYLEATLVPSLTVRSSSWTEFLATWDEVLGS